MRTWALRVLEACWWWGAALGIWLLSLSAVSSEELVVATLASLPCGPLAVAGRLVARNAWRARLRWFLPLLLVPVAILTDTAQVLGSAISRDRGHFSRRPVGAGSGLDSLAQGRRAAATFFTTLTPGTILLDVDPESGEALVHVVAERGPSMQQAATR